MLYNYLGGKIDWAHHSGEADLALSETIAMADAVAVADKLTSDQDTLIIVTADHAHTMTIVGYPDRGNPILGNYEIRFTFIKLYPSYDLLQSTRNICSSYD